MKKQDTSPIAATWEEVRTQLYTPEEIAECDLRVAIIGEMIRARQKKGISQKKLEEMSGVKQPVIARLESGASSPTLHTVMKLLAPLGKKLAVVDIDAEV